MNTEWWRGRPDKAVDKLPDFAAAYHLGPPPRELAELRALLRRLIEKPTDADRRRLASFVGRGVLRRRLVGAEVVLEPVTRDWDTALSEIASSFVPLLADSSRLRICANHECQWTFVDESRNHSRRWCGASSCGNADKVRRFRARQRAASA